MGRVGDTKERPFDSLFFERGMREKANLRSDNKDLFRYTGQVQQVSDVVVEQ
jgi:hypothetical protein